MREETGGEVPAGEHPLARIRQDHGWSYQGLARVVAENAGALGVPMAARREKVWRWEHWGVVPEEDSQRALARALGIPRRELRRRPWPQWLDFDGGVPSGLPWGSEQALAALTTMLDGGADDPSPAPVVRGPELREALADWAEVAAGPLPRRTPGVRDSTVDQSTVHWLESGLAGLRRLDHRLGGGAVRGRVEADLRLTADLLHRGGRDRHQRARLFRIAAELALLGGWACADIGRHAASQRHHLTGLRLAHSAGDRALAAGMLGGLSQQALLSGRAGDALAAAETALAAAPVGVAPPRVRSLLAARRAAAHARLGELPSCRRALGQAEELLGQADGLSAPGWAHWFGRAELSAQAGSCLLDLGLPEAAAPLLERGLAGLDAGCVRDAAVYTARAATARLQIGDLGGACELGSRLVRLVRRCGGPRPTAALRDFRALLAERSPGAASRVFGEVPTGGG